MKLTHTRSARLPELAPVLAFWLVFWAGGSNLHAKIPVTRLDLPNQMVVLVSTQDSLPFVTMHLLLDTGSWRDPVGKAGLANLTAKSLLLGTDKHTLRQINDSLDFMGTSLNVSCGFDYTVVSLKSLKKEFDRGLDLFLEIVRKPSFPQEELLREKERIIGGIRAENEDPTGTAQKRFRQTVFVRGPYRHPVAGTEATVNGLDRTAVTEFYRSYYRPNAAVLAIVGDIQPGEVTERVVPALAEWTAAEIADAATRTQFAAGPRDTRENRELSQANIVMGHGGIARANPDYYAAVVMNRILGGGGFSSRLMKRIRVERGLAYSVQSAFWAHRYPGTFQIVMQTDNAAASEAIALAREEMKRIQDEPVTRQELETAQKYLIGSFPLRLDSQSDLAAFLCQVVYYHLGLDYPERYPSLIRSVTQADVLRVARKYLHPNKTIVSIVGDLEKMDHSAQNHK